MGRRSERRRLDMLDAACAKATNRVFKAKERARRDVRMMEKLKTGSLPYTPPVMSWLSRKLDKRSGNITPEDIEAFVT